MNEAWKREQWRRGRAMATLGSVLVGLTFCISAVVPDKISMWLGMGLILLAVVLNPRAESSPSHPADPK